MNVDIVIYQVTYSHTDDPTRSVYTQITEHPPLLPGRNETVTLPDGNEYRVDHRPVHRIVFTDDETLHDVTIRVAPIIDIARACSIEDED